MVPGHPLPPPVCQVCQSHSRIFVAREFDDRGSRSLDLCSDCLRNRALVWERFVTRVEVVRVEEE